MDNNEIKKMIENSLDGMKGLIKVTADKLTEVKNMAVTNEQKKEFSETFVKSGLIDNFAEITKQFQEFNK